MKTEQTRRKMALSFMQRCAPFAVYKVKFLSIRFTNMRHGHTGGSTFIPAFQCWFVALKG